MMASPFQPSAAMASFFLTLQVLTETITDLRHGPLIKDD